MLLPNVIRGPLLLVDFGLAKKFAMAQLGSLAPDYTLGIHTNQCHAERVTPRGSQRAGGKMLSSSKATQMFIRTDLD